MDGGGGPNDSVFIESYICPSLCYSGKQRRAATDGIESGLSGTDHVARSLLRGNPFNTETPLPADLSKSLDVMKLSSPVKLIAFLAAMVGTCQEIGRKISPNYRKTIPRPSINY